MGMGGTVRLAWEAQKEKKDNTGEVVLAPGSSGPKEKEKKRQEAIIRQSKKKKKKQLGEHCVEAGPFEGQGGRKEVGVCPEKARNREKVRSKKEETESRNRKTKSNRMGQQQMIWEEREELEEFRCSA